jgi:hypothetical protein
VLTVVRRLHSELLQRDIYWNISLIA